MENFARPWMVAMWAFLSKKEASLLLLVGFALGTLSPTNSWTLNTLSENMDLCLENAIRYFPKEENSGSVICTEDYHLYAGKDPKESDTAPSSDSNIKLATFNLYHMGNSQSKFKDYDLVAEIMNRYDIIAATEVKALKSALERMNEKLDQKLQALIENRDNLPEAERLAAIREIRKQYVVPGYVKLLKLMQKLDSSWSYLGSPHTVGHVITHQEAMGFYYRRSKVDAISTAYCGDLVFGCFPKLTQQEKNLITRPPFIGSFQSGDFDFSVLVGHSRFRKHKDERKYQQIRDEILVDDFSEPIDFSIRETDEVIMGIYADAYHFGKIAQDVKNANPDEQDVIVAGDFNFPGTFEGQLNDWKTILDISYPGAEVVNNFETTVSQKEGVTPWEERHENRSDYASYDHFILDSMNSAECDVESNEALNFIPMIDEKFSLNGPWEERLQKLTAYREKLLAELVIEPGDDAEEERLDFTEDFNRRVLDPENLHDTWTLTEKELKRIADGKKIRTMGPFRSHLELISDHLPIAITCNTSFGDDD